MAISNQVFVVFGLIELLFGILNLLTSNDILLPGDSEEPAKSLVLLAGNLWSYAIISFGSGFLLMSLLPDHDLGKIFIAVTGLLYNQFMVASAGSRALKGWIFIGNKPGVLWHIAAITVHGTLALWFMFWIIQAKFYGGKKQDDKELGELQRKFSAVK